MNRSTTQEITTIFFFTLSSLTIITVIQNADSFTCNHCFKFQLQNVQLRGFHVTQVYSYQFPLQVNAKIHIYKMCSLVKKTTDVPTEIGHACISQCLKKTTSKVYCNLIASMQIVMHHKIKMSCAGQKTQQSCTKMQVSGQVSLMFISKC